MHVYSLSQLSDHDLSRRLASAVAQDRTTTAELLAHIAEFDARRLYLPAAYPSMHAYCVHELRLSEDAASKRIQAARTARKFPAIFDAVADGRLHLAAVCLLAPYLTHENGDDLLKGAAHKTKAEIEQLLAERFPRSEMLPLVQALPASPSVADEQLAPECVRASTCQHAPGHVEVRAARPRVTPIAPERFLWQFTVPKSTNDLLRYAQDLLSHDLPSGDAPQVLHRALEIFVATLEKRKFAATTRPQKKRRPTASKRHVPAAVKRAVWERDQGRCTFVSESGQRCSSRALPEFDHIDPVARGGEATVEGMQLLCRAHNQYAAECTFGTEFMNDKREESRRAAAQARVAAEAKAKAAAEERTKEQDVVPWLRQLGFRADESRRAAAHCESLPDASLEERVCVALAFLAPRARFQSFIQTASSAEAAACAPG